MQNIKPEITFESGKEYAVRDVFEKTLKYSNNNFVSILFSGVDRSFINQVYTDLGIYYPKTGGIEQDFVSVKAYAAVFRALYNASYLNQIHSNEILSFMSKSGFKSGIVNGVPNDALVSNKFGERVFYDSKNTQISELHDSGIIYKKDNPYI